MSDEERDLAAAMPEETSGAPAETPEAAGDEGEVMAEIEVESVTGPETPAAAAPLSTAVEEAGPSADERTWAALAHASVLLTFALGVSTGGVAVLVGMLAPLVIWLSFRERSRFVAYHALQATAFQVASLVAWILILVGGLVILIPTWVITALLLVVLIGFLLLPVALILTVAWPAALFILPFASLVYGLYGAFEVYSGRPFRYWRVADWAERRQSAPTAPGTENALTQPV